MLHVCHDYHILIIRTLGLVLGHHYFEIIMDHISATAKQCGRQKMLET